MRSPLRTSLTAMLAAATLLLGASSAFAGSRDIGLIALGRPRTSTADDPSVRRFRALANELAMVIAPKAWTSAESLGSAGFEFSFVLGFTGISGNQPYWRGTPGTPVFEGLVNGGSVPSGYWTPTLQVRKGLPFSTDVGVSVAYLGQSSMVALGLDLKVALFEAYIPSYLPDFALRGALGHLVGAQDLTQTTIEFDVMASYVIPISERLTLTPSVGLGQMWVRTASDVLDETPYLVTNPSDQAGGTSGSLYTMPTQGFGDNRFTRLWLGGRMVYGVMTVGYYLDLGFTPSGSDAHALSATHALKLGVDI